MCRGHVKQQIDQLHTMRATMDDSAAGSRGTTGRQDQLAADDQRGRSAADDDSRVQIRVVSCQHTTPRCSEPECVHT